MKVYEFGYNKRFKNYNNSIKMGCGSMNVETEVSPQVALEQHQENHKPSKLQALSLSPLHIEQNHIKQTNVEVQKISVKEHEESKQETGIKLEEPFKKIEMNQFNNQEKEQKEFKQSFPRNQIQTKKQTIKEIKKIQINIEKNNNIGIDSDIQKKLSKQNNRKKENNGIHQQNGVKKQQIKDEPKDMEGKKHSEKSIVKVVPKEIKIVPKQETKVFPKQEPKQIPKQQPKQIPKQEPKQIPKQESKQISHQIASVEQILVEHPTSKKKRQSSLFSFALKQAKQFFSLKKFIQASKLFREYIQKNINQSVQIDGVGQLQHSLGYYQWFASQWYLKQVNDKKLIGTVYDALSICYLQLRGDEQQMQRGINWYRQLVDRYPYRVQLIFGLANILNNKGAFDEAIYYYFQIIQMESSWVVPYECLAYIYEYRRISKEKSVEYARSIILEQSDNYVGMFILARNQRDPDAKIQKLKELIKIHPRYPRALNELGMVYGKDKRDCDEAILWYKRCGELAPLYSSCLNNIGVNYEMKKEYVQAIVWYFRAIQKSRSYKQPHNNLRDIFSNLKYSDDKIKKEMSKYKIFYDYFYYQLGLAYSAKENPKKALIYYSKACDCAKELKNQIYKVYNDIGFAYDDLNDNVNSRKFYERSIQANPKYCHSYFNLAILYQKNKNFQQAIKQYKKAIMVNPRFSGAHNNLGSIYKNHYENYQEASKYYQQAVQYNSTYTLGFANLGICYLKLKNYRQAFNALLKAKEVLPNDKNNLSPDNRKFLEQSLLSFQKQGQQWRQNGGISAKQQQTLLNLMKGFEGNFKQLYQKGDKMPVSRDKVLKKQICQIVKLAEQDQFELTKIDLIYSQVKQIFPDNEEYFHIIPQFLMQYFYKSFFIKKKHILDIESQLSVITQRLSEKSAVKTQEVHLQDTLKGFKLKNFEKLGQGKVNLFKNAVYFKNYSQIYNEIMSVNNLAKASYLQFKQLVDIVKKKAFGKLYGVSTKIPTNQKNQFKVILRVFQKMFASQLKKNLKTLVMQKMQTALREKQKTQKIITIGEVVHSIMEVWTNQISSILMQRMANKIQTKCQISDLLRGKVMFVSVDKIRTALQTVNDVCVQKGYKIIEMKNRLNKAETKDVVLKIQIKQAICQFQLALKQNEKQYHFVHSIYEIDRSPLGRIFGCYIFMSKGFQYPFLQNCNDIVEILKDTAVEEEKRIRKAANYIISELGHKKSEQ